MARRATESPEPTDCHYYLITRAGLAMTALLKRELAAAGVDDVRPAYLGVLLSLWKENNLKVAELGRRAGLEPSTMTGLIDRMERAGLVGRRADLHDRRAQRIRLTQRGNEVEEQVMQVVDATLVAACADVADQDLECLKSVLRQILTTTERLTR